MATDFIMPRVPVATSRDAFYPQQVHQQTSQPLPYNINPNITSRFTSAQAQAQANAAAASNFTSQYNADISPLSTPGNATPGNVTPTSAKVYQARQARPLYIPAVLRPTEHPSREGAPTPNAPANGCSADEEGGEESGDAEEDDASIRRVARSSGSFISLPGLGAFNIGRLSRRSTNDSGKCLDTTWNLDLFPEVNGLPSREHWKPDPESTMCDEPTCKRHFNYFTRRHHCRRCGNIFCDMHSTYEIPLDENANYNPRGSPSRACNYCFREFKVWRTRTNSADLSGNSTPGSAAGKTAATAPTSPVMALKGRQPGAPGTPTMARVADVAQSVPGDWNWSTF